ncbi:MAG: peptidyl-prolyl cis-trans isomerase [Thermodesulfobacteriota bacterium]
MTARRRGVRPRRARSAPLLRLLALGAAAFVASRALDGPHDARAGRAGGGGPLAATLLAGQAPAAGDDEVLLRAGAETVSAADPVVRLRLARLARYLELGGTAEGDAAELAAAADDLGLAARDVVVGRYLAEITRLALTRVPPDRLPSDDELRARYQRDVAELTAPPRVHAWHVYLSRERRGDALRADALRLLAELRAGAVRPGQASSFGDPFVRGAALRGAHAELERSLGRELADALDHLPAGSWQGPLASPYGLHLVWIERRTPARPEPFEAVRSRIAHRLLRERGDALRRERMRALRARYGLAPEGWARSLSE